MPPTPAELPSFTQPPVVEVAVGVHFLQLPGLTALPLVDLADTWKSDYPIRQEQPPLPPVFAAPGAMGFQVGSPPVRLWLTSSDDSVLLQLQRDRLLLNWRKLTEASDYPRYQRLRDEFTGCWEHLAAEVGMHEEYGVLQPAMAEVTFLNHIPAPSPADLGEILSALQPGWAPSQHLSTSLQVEEQIVDAIGNVVGQSTIGVAYRNGGLQLEVTSKVSLDGFPSDTSAILGALDVAHAAGVIAFDAATTEQAHKVWGKQ
ncbi:TIGR04255 family protein [Mycobacterium sp. MAA66]|uniref:TIGR04255 family protein n=1 Tax=Mycobacterium sp. MAA66 TaxID=3156297 RepID=UPI003518849D